MKLSCPSCSAKYSIADEKVHDRLAKIRCRKCSATIIIDGKVQPPHVYTSEGQHGAGADAAAPAGAGEGGDIGPGEYSVDFGDNDQRTMSIDQIIHAYSAGQVTNDTYVWAEGMGDWQPVSAVAEIQDAIRGAGGGMAPMAAPRASEPPRVAAARTGGGRGSATDLFGSIDTAGSEEDVTTSAPNPPPAAAAAGVATGARNESSVLFSLSALTAGAPAAPVAAAPSPLASSGPSPLAASSGVDDSGLIDLKALTASAGPGDMPAVSPFQVATAPLGMGAPLGGITHHVSTTTDLDVPMQKPSSNKTGLYIMGGLLGFGAIIAAALVATSGGSKDDEAAAAASAAAAAAAAATPTVTATATATQEEVTAKPPATGTSATEEKKPEETKAAPKTATARWRPKKSTASAPKEEQEVAPTPAKTTSSKSSSSDEEAPKPKPKPKSQCNCAPSDLMCAMRCAASH